MTVRLVIGPVDVDSSVREWVDTETLQRLVARHRRGDWGEVDARDARANVRAAYLQQGRLRSVYAIARDLQVWVITTNLGSDSLHTLVLIPEDD